MNFLASSQEQGLYINYPVLFLSLGLTVLAYGAFPLIYAWLRKRIIKKKKYTTLCYCINFLIMLAFIAVNGSSSGAPYFLWTWVFSKVGLRMLENKYLLDDCSEESHHPQSQQLPENNKSECVNRPTRKIRFCRKCGKKLKGDSLFCHKCGTKITQLTEGS